MSHDRTKNHPFDKYSKESLTTASFMPVYITSNLFKTVSCSAMDTMKHQCHCHHDTTVQRKGLCLIGKFKFLPNCVAILSVLRSGYQTFFETFNGGISGLFLPIKCEYFPGSAQRGCSEMTSRNFLIFDFLNFNFQKLILLNMDYNSTQQY